MSLEEGEGRRGLRVTFNLLPCGGLLKEKSLKVGEKIAKERSEGLRKRRLSCNEKHLKSSKLMLNLIQKQPRFLHVSDSIVSSSRETATVKCCCVDVCSRSCERDRAC